MFLYELVDCEDGGSGFLIFFVVVDCPLRQLGCLVPHTNFAVGFPLFQSSLFLSLSLSEEREVEGTNTKKETL